MFSPAFGRFRLGRPRVLRPWLVIGVCAAWCALAVAGPAPGNAKAHFQLALNYEREGQFNNALSHLDQAQALDGKLKFVPSAEVFKEVRQRVEDRQRVRQALQASEKREAELQQQVNLLQGEVRQLRREQQRWILYLGLSLVALVLVFVFRRRSPQAVGTPPKAAVTPSSSLTPRASWPSSASSASAASAASTTATSKPASARKGSNKEPQLGCFGVVFIIALLVGGFMVSPTVGVALLFLPLLLLGGGRR